MCVRSKFLPVYTIAMAFDILPWSYVKVWLVSRTLYVRRSIWRTVWPLETISSFLGRALIFTAFHKLRYSVSGGRMTDNACIFFQADRGWNNNLLFLACNIVTAWSGIRGIGLLFKEDLSPVCIQRDVRLNDALVLKLHLLYHRDYSNKIQRKRNMTGRDNRKDRARMQQSTRQSTARLWYQKMY